MIEKLNNKNEDISRQICSVFQASYKVEAELLNVTDFPPLNRKLGDFQNTNTEFYGFFKGEIIAGVIEVSHQKSLTDIESLVVHPEYFRQGIGKQLVKFVLSAFHSGLFTVETGTKNEPAIKLYKQLGFQELEKWDTESGIRKIRLKLVTHSTI